MVRGWAGGVSERSIWSLGVWHLQIRCLDISMKRIERVYARSSDEVLLSQQLEESCCMQRASSRTADRLLANEGPRELSRPIFIFYSTYNFCHILSQLFHNRRAFPSFLNYIQHLKDITILIFNGTFYLRAMLRAITEKPDFQWRWPCWSTNLHANVVTRARSLQ